MEINALDSSGRDCASGRVDYDLFIVHAETDDPFVFESRRDNVGIRAIVSPHDLHLHWIEDR